MIRWLVGAWLYLAVSANAQTEFDYGLHPQRIAADTWALIGRAEDITRRNGGNIANVGLVVTGSGVVVIDTGPTLRFGQQLRTTIERITGRSVVFVFNTHHHPDHFLGNQAFEDVPVLALPATRRAQRDEGHAFADNMYRMAGDWAAGTEVAMATQDVEAGPCDIGGRRFEVLAFSGHTEADLAVLDRTTDVLFAGDLVFLGRAPATPHARIASWLDALDRLERTGARWVVPGHGPAHEGTAGIEQTRDWLLWLDATLAAAATRGLDMAEAMQTPLPDRFASLPLARREFERSVVHLYRRYEEDVLGPATSVERKR